MGAATPLRPPSRVTAIRAALLTFAGDPFTQGSAARRYEPDAIVAMADGRILSCGPAAEVARSLPPGTPVVQYGHALISAGFVDAHVHYPQLPILGAAGKPLLDWLAAYTFPAEGRFGNAEHARTVAARYFDENLRNGITTACVFCTVHPGSVDALFEEAARRAMRIVGGKVLMDRNAPADLLDTAQRGYDESKALIERWHGRGRLAYAVTPRFAATSSPAQLEAAAALWRQTPGAFVQSHIAENRDELALVASLFPERSDYVDAYAHHGLLGRRAIYAHGIHLVDDELGRLAAMQTALAHCPTSNNFLGSGHFALHRAMASGVRVALGTDLGAGTSFSMFRTMQAACDVAHLQGRPLRPCEAWWMATGGGADALDLGDRIGRVAAGYDADLVVVDLHATPLLAFRMRYVADIDEALGVLLALGDDRAVRATYVDGHIAFDRDAPL
jgi:guanine deaminase